MRGAEVEKLEADRTETEGKEATENERGACKVCQEQELGMMPDGSRGAQSSIDGNRSSLRPEEATESDGNTPGDGDECMEGEEGRRPVMAPTPQRVSK